MANNTIQLKRSSVGGKQPNTSTLSIGELALNITDKKLYSSDGANIFEPAGNVSNLNVTGGIKANGSFGSNSQILTSNGSIVYWSTTTSAPINTQDAHPSSPVDGQIYWNSALGKLLIYYDDGNTSQWVEAVNTATPTSNVSAADAAYSNAISYTDTKIGTANTAMAANAAAAYSNAVSYVDAKIIDSVTNTSITHAASANSVKNAYDRAIDANTRANSAQTAAASAYSNAVSYADNKAANAYSNAVSYADGRIIDSVTNTSIVYAASANSVKNAYDRAIDANTRAGSAQTEAASAYTNATSYADNKAANAYSNAVSYTDGRIIDSVTNTSITHAASANSVKNAYDRAIDANTRAYSAQTEASNAYSNATSYADNKAANAYSNAVAYANSLIIDSVTNTSITYAASANSIKNAYDRAIDANTRANSAQTAAASAYSNAVSYVDTANFTRTGITTFSANIILGSSGLSSNGSFGTSGQVLSSNGTAAYWVNAAADFTNGVSISVNNFVITGTVTANTSNGTSGQVLSSNGTAVYWATAGGGAEPFITYGQGIT